MIWWSSSIVLKQWRHGKTELHSADIAPAEGEWNSCGALDKSEKPKQQDLHDSNSQVEMKVLQNTAEVTFTRRNRKSTAFLSLGGRGVAERNTNLQ